MDHNLSDLFFHILPSLFLHTRTNTTVTFVFFLLNKSETVCSLYSLYKLDANVLSNSGSKISVCWLASWHTSMRYKSASSENITRRVRISGLLKYTKFWITNFAKPWCHDPTPICKIVHPPMIDRVSPFEIPYRSAALALYNHMQVFRSDNQLIVGRTNRRIYL